MQWHAGKESGDFSIKLLGRRKNYEIYLLHNIESFWNQQNLIFHSYWRGGNKLRDPIRDVRQLNRLNCVFVEHKCKTTEKKTM